MTFEAFEHDRKMPINDFVFLNPFFFSEASRATQEDIFLYRWHLIPRGHHLMFDESVDEAGMMIIRFNHLNTVDPTKSCINGSRCNINTVSITIPGSWD